MVPSDQTKKIGRPFDWRAWLTLAWVAWFGLLYGKMVLEERGEKIRAAFAIFRR